MRPSETPGDQLTLVDIVRLDMRRYGPRLVRAEFAGGALLAGAPALAVLAVVLAQRPTTLLGQLLLLGLGLIFAGWCLNGLTLLVIACRQRVDPGTPDDAGLTHRAILRLVRLLVLPGSLPVVALRQGSVAWRLDRG